MKILKRIMLGLTSFVFLIACILAINYFTTSLSASSNKQAKTTIAPSTVSIFNWNLGYAGLGKDSDFVMDGGENLLPPSREIVEVNLAAIKRISAANKSDIHIYQEISKPDMLNYGTDVFAGVRDTMNDYNWFHTYDFRSYFIPTKYALKHGLASFSRITTSTVTTVRLPNEPDRLSGLIQRQYHMQLRDFTDENDHEWIVANLHMSAFDEGGNVRMKQFAAIMDMADEWYKQGKHVVIGGDWNMQLTPTDFPYTTSKEDLFWLAVFPHDKIKPNWKLAIDPNTPTVRSNERPYHKGENYTTIIDGFLVSPNVKIVDVHTIDTNFEFTDHQPVRAEFTAQ